MAQYKMASRFIQECELAKGVKGDYQYYYESNMSTGAFGIMHELEKAMPTSRKKGLSKQGKADFYIKVKANNKKGYKVIPAESKTNGGRIGELLDKANKNPNYPIVYSISLDVILKDGTIIQRDAFDRLFKAYEFFALLESCNAIKEHNESTNRMQKTETARKDYAIQVTKEVWFNAVLNWHRIYDRNAVNDLDS